MYFFCDIPHPTTRPPSDPLCAGIEGEHTEQSYNLVASVLAEEAYALRYELFFLVIFF